MNTLTTVGLARHRGERVAAKGPLSQWVLDSLSGEAGACPRVVGVDPMGDDAQLALYLCYEPHFGDVAGFVAVDEWDPGRIAFRGLLEHELESALIDLVGTSGTRTPRWQGNVSDVLGSIVAGDSGPSLSRHIEAAGTVGQLRDVVRHRSAYQLKEGDAHTFAIPRLTPRSKQQLIAIQSGEYGADAPGRVTHATLFAATMCSLGLSSVPNAYLDQLPASALLISNLVSLFGLNRRWRGALVGHLAVFEMTSVEPMTRYARGVRRLGLPESAAKFYDVHTLADIEHEFMAVELASTVAAMEPSLRRDVFFGAQCVIATERLFADALFDDWQSDDWQSVASVDTGRDDAAPDNSGANDPDPVLSGDEIHRLLQGEPWYTRY